MAITINTTGGDYSVLVSPVFERGLRTTVDVMLKAIKYYRNNRETLAKSLSPDVLAILDSLLVLEPVLLELARRLRAVSR